MPLHKVPWEEVPANLRDLMFNPDKAEHATVVIEICRSVR